MYKVLVMSDSHGQNENIEKAVKKAKSIAGKLDYAIHLGDIGAEYYRVPGMTGALTYMVAGNNDYGRDLRDMSVVMIGGHKILLTHGHRQGVSYDVSGLRYLALENECDIAMFGHTHVPFLNEGDVTILNPGSLTYPRQEGRLKTFVIMTVDDDDKVTFEFQHI